MSDIFSIDAQPRSDMGKGASRRLRHAGLVPGIIYGAHRDPEMVSLVHSDLMQHLENEAFYSHILTVNVGDRAEEVILKDIQRHPAKPFIQHVDFQRVSAREKIKTHVPIHFIAEDKAPGVKMGGMVSHHVADVEVSCLPKDLPEFIAVDMSAMELGDTVTLSGLVLPEGVEIPVLAQGDEYDTPVVSIHSGHAAPEEEEAGEEGASSAED
jgi:large subunit ribosomal protein L25